MLNNLKNISFSHAWSRSAEVTAKYENGTVSALSGADQIVHAVQHLHMMMLRLSAQVNVDVWTVGGLNANDAEVSFARELIKP